MKRAALITLCVLTLMLGLSSQAFASEVTGTISTGGNDGGTPNPVLTPNPTPNPTGTTTNETGGHSSEVEGGIAAGSGSDLSGTVVGGIPTVGWVTDWDHPVYGSDPNATATSTATSTDAEATQVALSDFGPRYGVTPGAPDAGGGGGDVGSGVGDWSFGNMNEVSGSEEIFPTSYPVLSRYGGVGAPTDENSLTANAIAMANGIPLPQLIMGAILALAIIASMGYAISRSANRTT